MNEVSNAPVDAGQPSADAVGETRQAVQQPQTHAPADAGRGELDSVIQERQKAKEKWRAEKARVDELQAKLDEIERAKAEEAGQYKDLYVKQKERADNLENNLVKSYVTNRFREEATRRGCVSVEAAMKLADMSLLQWDQGTGEVHGMDAVFDVLEKDYAFVLQTKPTPTVNPSLPGTTSVHAGARNEDFSKLNTSDLKARIAQFAKTGE